MVEISLTKSCQASLFAVKTERRDKDDFDREAIRCEIYMYKTYENKEHVNIKKLLVFCYLLVHNFIFRLY